MNLFSMVTDRGRGEQASSPVNEHVRSPNTITALPLSSFIPSLYPLRISLSAIGHIAKMPAILRVAVILVRATTNHEHGFPELETRERLLSASALIIHLCFKAPPSPKVW
jgi:hypothetical protein